MIIEGSVAGGILPLEDASNKEIIDNLKCNLICTSDPIKTEENWEVVGVENAERQVCRIAARLYNKHYKNSVQ
jgi:hypothetical protein